MKSLASSTALLASATTLHAMRVIALSLLLGDREFGAVSTLLLLGVLFADFGTLGFSQLVYNQPLFKPYTRSWQGYRVGSFLLAGMSLATVNAILVASVFIGEGPFAFVPLWLTLWCSALNVAILAACRASANRFTHPVAYAIKAIVILLDIVLLAGIGLPLDQMALWGEVVALPFLIFYAWRIGILRIGPKTMRSVFTVIRKNLKIGLLAIMSSATGITFFNQERIFGATFFTLEQMGVLTKLMLPKIIAAQASFLFGVHFHRWIIALDVEGRKNLFIKVKFYDYIFCISFSIMILFLSFVLPKFYDIFYSININIWSAFAISILSFAFFINPHAIFLQATNRFASLARANVVAVLLFGATSAWFQPATEGVLLTSALSAMIWFLIIRHLALRLTQ